MSNGVGDRPVVTDQVKDNANDAAKGQTDGNAALQKVAQSEAKPAELKVDTPDSLPKLQILDSAAVAGDAAIPATTVEAKGIADQAALQKIIRDGIEQAKQGKPVTFDIDARTQVIGADGQPIPGSTQASMLYDELKKAYPDKAYVFSKPDLSPGDQGYKEIPAPEITRTGVRLSSNENTITTAKDITLDNGAILPAGSKFAVGTLMDGDTVKSGDPSGKVWATTPDGTFVQVADAGKSATIPEDAISDLPKLSGQLPNQGDHIIIRAGVGVDPDGRPLLDVYPNSPEEFAKNYKPGTEPDMYAARPKTADHLLLPENITVQADTAWGPGTANGAKEDYFMTTGFGDMKATTAKNYTGVTDPRSAEELMRIRREVGLTDPTQVEAGLKAASNAPDAPGKAPEATPDDVAQADVGKVVEGTGAPAEASVGTVKSLFADAVKDPAALGRYLDTIEDPAAREEAARQVEQVRAMPPDEQARFEERFAQTQPVEPEAKDAPPAEEGESSGMMGKVGTAVVVMALVSAALLYAKSAYAAQNEHDRANKKVPFFGGSGS
jgi:hypothetical protein